MFNKNNLFNRINEYLFSVIFSIILIVLMIGIIVGIFNMLVTIWELAIHGKIADSYLTIISEVLTLFILIELSRSLADYFLVKRLRLTFIIDAGIVFVLREIMIKLFKDKITTDEIYALSVLLLVLGIIRIGSIIMHHRERNLLMQEEEQNIKKPE